MVRYLLACLTLVCLSSIVEAQGAQAVHKCVTTEGTVYQGTPCGPDALVAQIAARPVDSRNAPAVPECGRHARLPFGRGALCMGISDDEVLNLPKWGRPSTIVRTRSEHAWQEQWTYDARSEGTRRLLFLNGKLSSVEAAPAGPEWLSMDSSVRGYSR